MKLTEAAVIWRPRSSEIEVRRREELRGWRRPSGVSWMPAAAVDMGNRLPASPVEEELMMFVLFHTLVVRDQIPVEAAHRAFLAIDEYRRRISPDVAGAEG